MKPCIKLFEKLSEKQRQWTWFVGLWCGGLLSVTALGYLIRYVMGIQ